MTDRPSRLGIVLTLLVVPAYASPAWGQANGAHRTSDPPQAPSGLKTQADLMPGCDVSYVVSVAPSGECLTGTYAADSCYEIATDSAGVLVTATVKGIDPVNVGNARGVLVLLSGGRGQFWMEGNFSPLYIDHMLSNGYYVVQVRWNGPWGWFDHGSGRHNPFTVSCNVHSILEAIKAIYFDPIQAADKKFLALSTSIGSAQIMGATLWGGFDAIDGAIFVGGVPNYRLDHGCILGTDGSGLRGAAGPHLVSSEEVPLVTVPRVVLGPSGKPILDGSECVFSDTTPRGNRGAAEQVDADILMTTAVAGGTKLFDRAYGDVQTATEMGRCSNGEASAGRSLYEHGSIAKLLHTRSFGFPIFVGLGETDQYGSPYQAVLMNQDPNFNGGNGFAALECIEEGSHNITENFLGALWIIEKLDVLDALPEDSDGASTYQKR